MDSIVDTLMNQLGSGDNLSTISTSVGGDPNAVKSALGLGLPMLVSSMADTASKPGGADMLTKMMSQMGGSNPMDNVSGYLGNPEAAGGSGIVNSLLGSQMGTIQNTISQKTGLPPAMVGKVLAIAAPLVLGYASKMFTQQKMDTKVLTNLLGEQSKMAMQSSPEAANMAKQVVTTKVESGGVMSKLKKLFGS